MSQIHEKIIAIMAESDAIAKGRRNQQQGFNFRGIDDVYNSLHPLLAKHGVFSTTEVIEERTEERTTKSGSALIYRMLKVKFHFYAADGSTVESVIIGEGMDSGDKASNKAMAVAHKYALLQLLAIPTEDAKDPDMESHEVAPRREPEPGYITPATDDHLKARARLLADQLGIDADARKGIAKAAGNDIHKIVKALEKLIAEKMAVPA